MRVVIVTGLAGAGKTTALRALEDMRWRCVDNLPLPLFGDYIELMAEIGEERLALSVDGRQHEFLDRFASDMTDLRQRGHTVEVLFLEANNTALIRRFSETRRRHPLAGDKLSDGIDRDREVLALLREDATVVDTGDLNVHELRGRIEARYGRELGELAVTLQSFGFKHGVPSDSDLVFDVRFLPNPHFDDKLRPRDGRDEPVARYVLESADGAETVSRIEDYLRFALPRFADEGKSYITVSIGCTGGRHRSVAIAEDLRERLSSDFDALVRHRDLNRGGTAS